MKLYLLDKHKIKLIKLQVKLQATSPFWFYVKYKDQELHLHLFCIVI